MYHKNFIAGLKITTITSILIHRDKSKSLNYGFKVSWMSRGKFFLNEIEEFAMKIFIQSKVRLNRLIFEENTEDC
jgi:hypothetical protein